MIKKNDSGDQQKRKRKRLVVIADKLNPLNTPTGS